MKLRSSTRIIFSFWKMRYTTTKRSKYSYNTSFMKLQNVVGPLVSRNGITKNSYNPYRVTQTVFASSPSAIRTCQYPDQVQFCKVRGSAQTIKQIRNVRDIIFFLLLPCSRRGSPHTSALSHLASFEIISVCHKVLWMVI